MAEGSLEESRYYQILAQDPGYGDTATLASALEEVSRLLSRSSHSPFERVHQSDQASAR